MNAAKFTPGQLVTVAAGFGYWDVTSYPYGGQFRRASSSFGAVIIGPGGKYPAREFKIQAVDRTLIIDGAALSAVP